MRVEKITEHEDGSANVNVEFEGEQEQDMILELGLKFAITMAASGLTVDEALAAIMDKSKGEET